MERQIVVYQVGGEEFGSDIASVDSIIRMQPLSRIPHSPFFVEGITNLRGSILPVVDLRKRFGMPVGEISNETRIVVINFENLKLGMIVDAVLEVVTADEASVEAPPPMVTTVKGEFISGIFKIEERLVILLDLGKVLAPSEQDSLQALPDEA